MFVEYSEGIFFVLFFDVAKAGINIVFFFSAVNGVWLGWEKHIAVTVIQKEKPLLH